MKTYLLMITFMQNLQMILYLFYTTDRFWIMWQLAMRVAILNSSVTIIHPHPLCCAKGYCNSLSASCSCDAKMGGCCKYLCMGCSFLIAHTSNIHPSEDAVCHSYVHSVVIQPGYQSEPFLC